MKKADKNLQSGAFAKNIHIKQNCAKIQMLLSDKFQSNCLNEVQSQIVEETCFEERIVSTQKFNIYHIMTWTKDLLLLHFSIGPTVDIL